MRHYNVDELSIFIEGETYNADINQEIKSHLKECIKCYKTYIELKEIKYFKEEGEDMPESVLNKIISMGEKQYSKRLSIIIYYTKKTIRVFSEDNFELKTQFLDVSFATRGGKELANNNDAFMLKKTVRDFTVTLNLSRLPDHQHFNLSIELKQNNKNVKNIRAYLKENGQEIEFIEIAKHNAFDYKLEASEYELYFEKDKNELFSISLKLREED